MKNNHELECAIDRLGQEVDRLAGMARAGEKAIAELQHFRKAFGIAPDTDLVTEFDRRARESQVRKDMEGNARMNPIVLPGEIQAALKGASC